MVLGKLCGQEDEPASLDREEMAYVTSVCVSMLQCAVDGTRPPDGSLHPTVQSASMVVAALCSGTERFQALYDSDVVHVITKALLSVKARGDMSKGRTEGTRTARQPSVGSADSGSRSSPMIARLHLLKALWHLSNIPVFIGQIRWHSKLLRQLKAWGGDDSGTGLEVTPRARDEPDQFTTFSSLAIVTAVNDLVLPPNPPKDHVWKCVVVFAPVDAIRAGAIVSELEGTLTPAQLELRVSQLSLRFNAMPTAAEIAADAEARGRKEWDIANAQLSEMNVLITCLSRSFTENPHCRMAVSMAKKANRPIVAIQLDNHLSAESWTRCNLSSVPTVTGSQDPHVTNSRLDILRREIEIAWLEGLAQQAAALRSARK